VTAVHLDAEAVDAVLTRPMALAAAREAAALHAKGGVVSGRTSARTGNAWVRVMLAMLPGRDELGYKEFHVSTDPVGIRYTCHLFRLSSGEPLGTVDGFQITRYRTAATAALAVTHVFGNEPVKVAFVGSGGETRAGFVALSEVLEIAEACVHSPRAESRASFVADMGAATGMDIRDAPTLEECVAGADLVYAVTHSWGEVVLRHAHIEGLRMLVTLGSTMPIQREVDGPAFSLGAPLVVDTLDALEESGDLIAAAETIGLGPDEVELLGDFLDRPFSPSPDGRPVIYKSIGSPEQDLLLAGEILAAAAAGGASSG
jgi:ornithine cyclodeaminase/alanine dehydrogenase-like protein (mu-crystallin family)